MKERTNAYRKVQRAERFAQQAREYYKNTYCRVGGKIYWTAANGTVQTGTVVRHGANDRLLVRNAVTKKEYWIHLYTTAGCEDVVPE